jgi:hypothetical protein
MNEFGRDLLLLWPFPLILWQIFALGKSHTRFATAKVLPQSQSPQLHAAAVRIFEPDRYLQDKGFLFS